MAVLAAGRCRVAVAAVGVTGAGCVELSCAEGGGQVDAARRGGWGVVKVQIKEREEGEFVRGLWKGTGLCGNMEGDSGGDAAVDPGGPAAAIKEVEARTRSKGWNVLWLQGGDRGNGRRTTKLGLEEEGITPWLCAGAWPD